MDYPQPISNLVLLKRQVEQTQTASGIIIPDTAQKTSMKATVLAVGPGKLMDNGVRGPMEVKPGDCVLIAQWTGCEIKNADNEKWWFVKEDELLAVVEP